MACKDCFNNCDPVVNDACVKYMGPDIPLFGICTGDTLSSIEEIIFSKLTAALNGTGITVNAVTFANAPWLAGLFGTKDKTLANLIQVLVDSNQTLKGLIEDLQETPTTFNTSCLTGLPSSPTKDDIIAALITNFCVVKSTVNAIPATYVKLSNLTSLVNNIITTGPSGTTASYKNRMVPFIAYPYEGPLSNFDSTGKGIVSAGFERVFICNGLNGTKDYRGRTLVGATRNIPGGTLDAAVNPNSTANSLGGVDYGIGDKVGENYNKLTIPKLPPHSHPLTDPGHSHALPTDAAGSQDIKAITTTPNADEGYSSTTPTGISVTGITIGNAGSGEGHYNVQPSIAVVYIIHIP